MRAACAATACALAAALSGCTTTGTQQGYNMPPVVTVQPAQQQQQQERAAFKAVLTGREAVPASDSQGKGELVAVLDLSTGALRWKINFSGLSGPVRSANFHSPAMSGEVAPPVLPAGGRSITSPYEGRALLTPAQRDDLLAGQWYLNLNTARYPDGELRGQLIEQH